MRITCPHCNKDIKLNVDAKPYDEIEQQILDDGYIPNNNIWRRWIMAQMLRHYKDPATGADTFNAYFIKNKPYMYQWTTLLNEINAVKRMSLDSTDRSIRLTFFNKDLLVHMLTSYRDVISKLPKNRFWHVNCDKTKYLNMIDGYIKSAVELQRKQHHTNAVVNKMADLISDFIKNAKIRNKLPKSKAWIDAFKGNGSYYTMDNMIKFHGCRFWDDNGSQTLNEKESLNKLLYEVCKCNPNEFYKLFGLMKEFIEYNNYDINTLKTELQHETSDA